jgi:hypothetical protein
MFTLKAIWELTEPQTPSARPVAREPQLTLMRHNPLAEVQFFYLCVKSVHKYN